MDYITFDYGNKLSELELVLEGITVVPGCTFLYGTADSNERDAWRSPVYVLPVDKFLTRTLGMFNFAELFGEFSLGFVRQKQFLEKEYYHLSSQGRFLLQEEPVNDRLYLPLRKTQFGITLGKNTSEGFIPYKESPFTVFGLQGVDYEYPLILATETEQGLCCRGIYQSANGRMDTYSMYVKSMEPILRDHLANMRLGFIDEEFDPAPVLPVQKKKSKEKENKENTESVEVNQDHTAHIVWEEPRSMVSYLDRFVIGQDEAKVTVAVVFSNYMARVEAKDEELPKDNLLFIGPSGSGKTYMLSLLAKEAKLPMATTSLTGKSAAGYIEESVSVVFDQLANQVDEYAPYAIVFLDEIDKVVSDNIGAGSGFGPKIQDELIGMLEDAVVLDGELCTKNILFVTAGAFQGLGGNNSLLDIIQKRKGGGKPPVGFAVASAAREQLKENPLQQIMPEDLVKYGLKPELVGRLPSIAVFNPLSIEDKVHILTTAEHSPITSYSKLFAIKGYNLIIQDGVYPIIASHCPPETGARALKSICNNLFKKILFDPRHYAMQQEIVITSELADDLIDLYEKQRAS